MELCYDGHDEVCFEGKTCPACNLKDEVLNLRDQIQDLEEEIKDLEEKLEEATAD